ncbi:MAG: prolyl oligopeptidase family serine peptidase [Armatimonadetes bacterium]|nr:prolyl oligopeptidase family serine peptidase [Armatimonadota bacterium]
MTKIIRILLATALILSTAAALAAPAKPSPMWQLYQRAERFGQMSSLVYKSSVDARWIGSTHKFWYRNDVRGENEFILVDAERGARAPAFDHEKLAASLTKATGNQLTKGNLPFTSISFSDDFKSVIFRFGSQGWNCDLQTYECAKCDVPKSTDTVTPPAPRRGNPERGRQPENNGNASIKNFNIYLKSPDGTEKQLTTDGDAKNEYAKLSWSPDNKTLAAWRTQPGDNLPIYTIESAPKDSLRPKLHQTTYALPGDKIDNHELYIFTPDGKQIRPKTDPVTYGEQPEIRWMTDGRFFTFEQTDRAYKRVRVMKVDSQTGDAQAISDEQSATFVFPPCEFSKYLDKTNELIWPSERDGWCHLYLFDTNTCTLKNQITKGEWVVRGVESVDEAARQIVFTACGREPGQDPYLLHYYRVNFDGTGLTCLTSGNGQHTIRFSPDKAYYLDTYSRADLPPVTELRMTADGSLICPLEQADAADLLKTGWKMPEPFVAKARDGVTDIYGVIFRPSNLNARKKYPVIEDIYAGPQGSFTPKTFSANRGNQALAELGFIVVQIDGLGTANRSKAFHDVCYKNLGDSGFPDRILWMKAAAAKYKYIDLTRVGIHGMSAGGYNSAHALLAHPEFYKVAVSMSGNHDHRTDKVWWNELWMGYPIGPHYAEQSNITMANKLEGKLLLVHGDLDDNVNPAAATLQFADALIKANKDFDLLIIPGMSHQVSPYEQRRLWDYYVKNLQGQEPPKGYQLNNPAGAECNITVKNLLDKPIELFWVADDGKLTKYPEVGPGQKIQRHTYIGHKWEAHADGKLISSYTATAKTLEWVVAE